MSLLSEPHAGVGSVPVGGSPSLGTVNGQACLFLMDENVSGHFTGESPKHAKKVPPSILLHPRPLVELGYTDASGPLGEPQTQCPCTENGGGYCGGS